MNKPLDTQDLRESFRPGIIRILFVGESPPKSGKFFYRRDSQMYKHIHRVLGKLLFEDVPEREFLSTFKNSGCYLDDLILKPCSEFKKQDRRQGVLKLGERIGEYHPKVVVALLKQIEFDVRSAVEISKIETEFFCTHFPGNGHQGNFEDDIKRILPELKHALR